MVRHGKSNQSKIWWYAHHPHGQAASERPHSAAPRYFLVRPHVTARLPPPGEVPAFNDDAYGSPE
eukprot:1657658-Alexandrium_andersonii.AAC.1